MLGCSICPSTCLLASKWKHPPLPANPCPLPGLEEDLTLLAWPEQGVSFIVWLQLQWSSIGLLDKFPHTPSATWITLIHFCFLIPLFATLASPFLCLNLSPKRQPAPNYFFLISPSFAISMPKFSISDTASQVISALCAITSMVTRHVGLARSYFPECPQCSPPAVWFSCFSHTSPLTTWGIQPALTAPSVAFASFSQYSLSHPAFHMSHPLARPLASIPFPGSSTSGWQPGACSAITIPILQAAALLFACKWSIWRLLIYLFDNVNLSLHWKVLPFWGYVIRKSSQRSPLSSCMFSFPANAKTHGCVITKKTQRRWSWNVCGCPCMFLGKSTVSPLVLWGWWNDSAWLFLSHLQECVRCHFESAKRCWISAQTKTLAMGTVEVLMRETWGRGGESSQWQKGKALVRCSLCLCPSPGTPILLDVFSTQGCQVRWSHLQPCCSLARGPCCCPG